MSKVRVDELASEFGLSPDDLFVQLKGMGFDVVNITSSVDRGLIDMVSDMLVGQPVERDSSARRIVSVRKGESEPEVEVRVEEEALEEAETELEPGGEEEAVEADAAPDEAAAETGSDQAEEVGSVPEEEETSGETVEKAGSEKPKKKLHITALTIEKKIGGVGDEIPTAKVVERRPDVQKTEEEPKPVQEVKEKKEPGKEIPIEVQEPEKKKVKRTGHRRERKPTVKDLLGEVEEMELVEEEASGAPEDEPTLKVVEIKHTTTPQPGRRREIPRKRARKARKQESAPVQEVPKPPSRAIKISTGLTVGDLAGMTGTKASEIIKILLELGIMATINQTVDPETASLIVGELGFEVQMKSDTVEDLLKEEPEDAANQEPRPPVITVMGHVDHGKTSLLDAVRETDVVSGEAGGITQHIGAHLVKHSKGEMVFLDTPGHEAFTAMRARGASVTDIVVLVVAADDGVMPQTVEAIDHAKAAGVPIVVAVNKIDKPEADPDRVKRELAERNVVPEDWGGDALFVNVSAKKGTAIDDLLDVIMLQAEMLELTADPGRDARGIVVESRLERGRGPVATVLVQSGTLKTGDLILAGTSMGRVRVMNDDRGKKMEEAGPSIPAEVVGLHGIPEAGDSFVVFSDEVRAKRVAQLRTAEADAGRSVSARKAVSLEDLFAKIQEGELKDLNIVLKADVQGSAGAIRDVLDRITSDEVRINVIHQGTGGINEGDIILASASHAIVIGFNVRPDNKSLDVIRKENVDVRFYNVIYELEKDIKNALKGMLAPVFKEETLGRAEVRETFVVPKVGTIAGSHVNDGLIRRNSEVRVLRDGIVIFEGKIGSLRRFKDDVKEVASGFECGIGVDDYNDIKIGDVLESFEIIQQEVEFD